jgi:hypothetical protein
MLSPFFRLVLYSNRFSGGIVFIKKSGWWTMRRRRRELPSKDRSAVVGTRRRDAILADRNTVNPLGVGAGGTLGETGKVASAVAGREQPHDASVGVLDLSGLSGLEADAVSLAGDRDLNRFTGVVCDDELPVSESEGTVQGAEGQQQDGLCVHFLDAIVKWIARKGTQ